MFDKDSAEWWFFHDFYKFCEEYYNPKPGTKYFQNFMMEMDAIIDKYCSASPQMNIMASNLLMGFCEYIAEYKAHLKKEGEYGFKN